MIVSHSHGFIFIKTRKTAGSSVEIFLEQLAGEDAIVTPIHPPAAGHRPRHYQESSARSLALDIGATLRHGRLDRLREGRQRRDRYWNHLGAREIRRKLGRRRWDAYYKFTVERDPWEKTISQYFYEAATHSGGAVSFEEFVMTGVLPTDFGKYSLDGSRLAVDDVIQYDQLTAGLTRVLQQLGLAGPVSLERAKGNLRPKEATADRMFTERTKDRVASVFAREIAAFGYPPPVLSRSVPAGKEGA